MKQRFSTQLIVEAGIMLSLAYVLSLFKIYEMPYGGSISLSMLPIIIFSIRWGLGYGILIGALYSLIGLILKPYVIHPIQLILDYPLPSAFIGISALSFSKDRKDFKGYVPFIIIGYTLKFITHYFSGVIFFSEYTPEGMDPKFYSFMYNLQYNLPELIIALVVVGLLWKPLNKFLSK